MVNVLYESYKKLRYKIGSIFWEMQILVFYQSIIKTTSRKILIFGKLNSERPTTISLRQSIFHLKPHNQHF